MAILDVINSFVSGVKKRVEDRNAQQTSVTTREPITSPLFDTIQSKIPQLIDTNRGLFKSVEVAKQRQEEAINPSINNVFDAIKATAEPIIKYSLEYPSRAVGARFAGQKLDISTPQRLKESIESAPLAFEAVTERAVEKGLPEPVGLALGLGVEAIIPGPGELKALLKPNILKTLVKETDEVVIKDFLIKEAKLSEAQATQIAKQAAPLKTEAEVRALFEPKPEIPKDLEPLAQEARKYKSAEEFVKAQRPTYHGSPTPLKSFSNKKGGVFFTEEYADATGFAGSPDNVYEGYLNFKKPLVIDAKGAKWDELNTKWGKSTQEIVSNAQKEGYDGVTFKNIVDNIGDTADFGGQTTIHYAYKPKDAFLNESQLTDLYNQVVKGDVPDLTIPGRIEVENAVTEAFKKSTNQEQIGTFEIGSFGKNSFAKKSEQIDRFPLSELEETQTNIKRAYKASDDPNNYRKDNIAWIAEMPNGEKRVIYTRQNEKGVEEIINAHKISQPNFEETLKTFGVPTGNRTQILSLERSSPSPLNDRDIISVTQTEGKASILPTSVEKGIKSAESKFEADQVLIKQTNQKVPQGKKPSFWQELKTTFTPFKNAEPKVKEAWQTRIKETAIANEKANEEFLKLKDIPKEKGFETMINYQAGVETPYSAKIKETFDSLYKEANARGYEVGYLENYIPQVYANTSDEIVQKVTAYMKGKGISSEVIKDYVEGKVLPEEISRTLKMNPMFVKERAFPDYATAIEFGLTPKYSHPAQLAGHYRNELEKTLANRKFIDTMKENGDLVGSKPQGYKAVDLPFMTEELYAKPRTAKALEDYFRDEDNLGVGARIAKFTETLSGRMQNLVLSGGVPSTSVNFFSLGTGVIKDLTAAETKVLGNFARSNFDTATLGWFRANQSYITKMSEEGINLSQRTGNWDKAFDQLSSKTGLGRISEKTGQKFDDLFSRKTFQNFMPMQSVSVFKNTYDSALQKGLSDLDARKLAGDTTKAWTGIIEDWGRGKTAQSVINSIFFAPRFRETLINLFGNTVKSLSTQIANPAFAKNRKFIIGAVITYAGYNLLNKKLNGSYMWENEKGKEFDLKIPLGNGKYTYIAFLPSVLAFPRNMISGGIAALNFDTEVAGQKFGSVFSMPIKLASEVLTNRDYFGRPIWDVEDSKVDQLKSIAKYIGIDQYNHPYVQGLWNLAFPDPKKPKDWYEIVSRMAEMPFKFNSLDNINRGKYYDALDEQKEKRAEALEPIRKIYDDLQKMKVEGKQVEADKIYFALPENEKKLYNDIKTSEKTKATNSLKARLFPLYLQLQDMKAEGRVDEANAIHAKLSAEEKRIYKLIKNQFKSYE